MKFSLTYTAFIVGFFGDILLQLFTISPALHKYFARHGRPESVLLGSMFTGFITWIYTLIYPYLNKMLNLGNTTWFILYSIFIDELYRQYHSLLFPTLTDWYVEKSRLFTISSNILIAISILFVQKVLNKFV